MKILWRLILILALLFSIAVVAWAEDDDSSIFGESDMTEEIPDGSSSNENKALTEKLTIGGDFSFGLTPMWTYTDNVELPQETMGSNLIGRLYFDARPDEDSRYFGKIRVTYPFTNTTTVVTDVTENPLDPTELIITKTSIETVNLQIQELFADFNYQDKIFFRAGKHTIKWGVGYFFSPADVLNLTPIDPTDPEAEREGPVSFRIHYPFGENKVNNFYGYLIANNAKKPGDLAIALNSEYLLGNLELGVGGFYQSELAPRLIMTATLPTKTLDFFGELVLSYGSDKTFVEETGGVIVAVKKEDELFPSLTIGFNAMTDRFSVACQYLYNGEGYLDPALLRDKQPEIAGLIATGKLKMSDLYQPGRHYGAVSLSFLKLFNNPDLSFSLFWLESLIDDTGQITPKFSWKMLDKLNLSISLPYFFGETGAEFVPFGSTKSLSIGISLGNGRF